MAAMEATPRGTAANRGQARSYKGSWPAHAGRTASGVDQQVDLARHDAHKQRHKPAGCGSGLGRDGCAPTWRGIHRGQARSYKSSRPAQRARVVQPAEVISRLTSRGTMCTSSAISPQAVGAALAAMAAVPRGGAFIAGKPAPTKDHGPRTRGVQPAELIGRLTSHGTMCTNSAISPQAVGAALAAMAAHQRGGAFIAGKPAPTKAQGPRSARGSYSQRRSLRAVMRAASG